MEATMVAAGGLIYGLKSKNVCGGSRQNLGVEEEGGQGVRKSLIPAPVFVCCAVI